MNLAMNLMAYDRGAVSRLKVAMIRQPPSDPWEDEDPHFDTARRYEEQGQPPHPDFIATVATTTATIQRILAKAREGRLQP